MGRDTKKMLEPALSAKALRLLAENFLTAFAAGWLACTSPRLRLTVP